MPSLGFLDHPDHQDSLILINEMMELFAEDLSDSSEEKALRETLDLLISTRRETLYSDLIWSLSGIRLSNEQAESLWGKFLEHKYLVSEKLGRNIGIRVAALDYLLNFESCIKMPRILDHNTFKRLYQCAHFDLLTGLLNRHSFETIFKRDLSRTRRYKVPASLLLLDIDNFKSLNDTYGHETGDQVLKKCAMIIRSAIRDCDYASRWGGEEFVVFYPNTPLAGAKIVSERIRSQIEKSLGNLSVTISGGLVDLPFDTLRGESPLHRADKLLYEAKHQGKNRIITISSTTKKSKNI